MNIDLATASSELQGFGYVTNATATLNISSFALGAGATSGIFSTTLNATVSDAAALTRVMFSGVGNTDVNNQWVFVHGSMYFRNSSPSYDVGLGLFRVGTGQLVQVQFQNTTGVTQTVPNITVSIKSYFYDAPW